MDWFSCGVVAIIFKIDKLINDVETSTSLFCNYVILQVCTCLISSFVVFLTPASPDEAANIFSYWVIFHAFCRLGVFFL